MRALHHRRASYQKERSPVSLLPLPHKNKVPHSDDRNFIPEEKFAEEVRRNGAMVAIPDDWKEKFLAQIELWQNDEAQARQQMC